MVVNKKLYLHTKFVDMGNIKLPRNCHASDLDMIVFDNAGKFLFLEYKSRQFEWSDMTVGQQLLYFNLLRSIGSGGVALIHHKIEENKTVDGIKDAISFKIGRLGSEEMLFSKRYDGAILEKYILKFFDT